MIKVKTIKVHTASGASRKERRARACTWQNFKLFSILYAKGYLRTKDLMEELEITERVAQRLMEPYKEDGILIRDESDQGKWLFNENQHCWNKSAVSGRDASTLAFICKLSKIFGKQISDDLMNSVAKKFLLEEPDYPYFMITPRVKSPNTKMPFYDELYAAITGENKILLTYQALNSAAPKTIKAWPVSFIMCDGMWYLGYLQESVRGKPQNIRTLRYGHIHKVEWLPGENFVKPAWVGKTLKEACNIWFSTKRDTRVLLEIDNWIKDYFLLTEYFPRQKIVAQGKHTFRLETTIANELEVIPTILRFMPLIKVLSPGSLRESIRNKVKKYLVTI